MTPPDTPLIRARNLSVAYGQRVVLQDVSLDIQAGELWCLLGSNGEGKTTFVRAVLGLLPVYTGRLEVRASLAGEGGVGFVPQRCELNPTLPTTLREFVSLGLVGSSIRAGQRAQRLAWALQMVGLEDRARSDYWALSGGQRQRALVARALIRKPTLLILDEPIGGMDPNSAQVLLDLLRRLNRDDRLTILLVTHDIRLAAEYASHVALFHCGRVIAGAASELLTADTLAQVFGTPVSASASGSIAPGLAWLGGHH